MKFRTYFKNRLIGIGGMIYLSVALIVGAIPAATIILRADLIDYAVANVAGGDGGPFFAVLAIFCAICLLSIVLQAVSLRLVELHKLGQTNKLDNMRINKSARILFPVTESAQFHILFNKAAKAPEADGKLYQAAGDIVRSGARIILSLVTIFFVDMYTAVGMVVLLIFGIFLNSRLAKTTEGFWSNYIENMRRTNYLSSLLMQKEFAAERKIFSYDDEIESRYEEQFEKAKKQNAKAGKRRLTVELIMQLSFAIYSVAALLLLLRPFIVQDITIGVFTSTFYAATGLLPVSRQLYAGVYTAVESGKQLGGFVEFMALPEDCAEGKFEGGTVDTIEFDNVTFTYPGADTPVLNGINLRLKSGRHYAIVGENGCGKTTFVKLLLGLYKPDSGKICLNGQSVDELPVDERRKIFAAVFQDFYKYPLTLRENVSLFLPQPATDGQIDENTLLGKEFGGTELSGGQWQRLAIARGFYKDAEFIVLDEPTSAIDPLKEKEVYEEFRCGLKGRTGIIVTHRLGAVNLADKIVVLKQGRVAEYGTGQELIAARGEFFKFWNSQREAFVTADMSAKY